MRRSAILLLTALFAVAAMPLATAQTPYEISGSVVDQDGQPVAGAAVRLYQYGDHHDAVATCDAEDCKEAPQYEGESTSHEASATTDAEGRFSVPARDGWASISIQKEGHAGHYDDFEVAGDQELDVELLRYPDKTAHVQGRISADADRFSISIENPEHGIHACSVMAGEGRGEAEPMPGEDGSGSEDGVSDGSSSSDGNASTTFIAPGPDYREGCDITLQPDGSFSGNVTPGYSIIRVYADDWQRGGPGHYGHSVVRDLPADATTALDIRLQARPGPDATLKGYVLDRSGDPVADAQVMFHNQDAYGWAEARTDSDGSYQVKLRSGYTGLNVWAEGYLPWEGQVQVAPGDDLRRDVTLRAGEARYGGGCCWIMEARGGDDGATSEQAAASGDGDASTTSGEASGSADRQSSGAGFEDLGGGLGPYEATRAADQDGAAVDVPGFQLAAVAMGLLAGLLLMRRR